MTPFESVSSRLVDALHLAQPPVAIAFSDAIPSGVPAYQGFSPAGCRFWQEASERVFATVPHDHELCSIGMYTHHLEGNERTDADLQDALKVFGDLTYVRPEDIASIPVLTSQRSVVVYGPLASIPLAPDVVLLFVNSDQMLILSEASQQVENGLPPAMGRPACAVIPQAINTGRTALSLGCCGARAYLDILSPSVAMYAIPGSILEAFTERVTALAHANQILAAFHAGRRRAVEEGARPTIKESLAAM